MHRTVVCSVTRAARCVNPRTWHHNLPSPWRFDLCTSLYFQTDSSFLGCLGSNTDISSSECCRTPRGRPPRSATPLPCCKLHWSFLCLGLQAPLTWSGEDRPHRMSRHGERRHDSCTSQSGNPRVPSSLETTSWRLPPIRLPLSGVAPSCPGCVAMYREGLDRTPHYLGVWWHVREILF